MRRSEVLLPACLLFAGAAVLVLSGPGWAQMGGMMGDQSMMTEQGQNQKPGTQQESMGARIFREQCAGCHPNGGNSMVRDLPVKGSRVLASFKAFRAFLRNPRMPDGSRGAMPSFAKSKIPDKEVKVLYAFASAL